MRRMSANNHRGQEVKIFHKQAGYMRAMIFSHIEDQMSCKRSESIYLQGTARRGSLLRLRRLFWYRPRIHYSAVYNVQLTDTIQLLSMPLCMNGSSSNWLTIVPRSIDIPQGL